MSSSGVEAGILLDIANWELKMEADASCGWVRCGCS